MPDKKQSKYTSLNQFLGKAAGETLTEKDIQKGLNSNDPHVVKMAKNAEKALNRKSKVSKEDLTELNAARILSAQIGMEAFAGGDISILLTDSFPTLVHDIKNFFSRFVPNAPGVALNFNEYDFIKRVNKHNYLDISPLTAYVPEGLDVTYLKYSNELMLSAIHASGVLNGIMSKYTVFLSQLINSNDVKLSTLSFSNEHVGLTTAREKLNDDIGKCFKHGSTKAETTLGKVTERNSDWKEVLDKSQAIIKLINSVDRSALNKKIHESVTYLNIILNKIERHELNNSSPEVVNNLSSGAYQVASELEFFSITYYRILAFVNSIENTVTHFNKVFSNKDRDYL